MYYDKQGKKLTMLEHIELFGNEAYGQVGKTELPDGSIVSTVWMGIDHGFVPGEPVIFETMVFDKTGESVECRRYSTEAEAKAGHTQAVKAWAMILS